MAGHSLKFEIECEPWLYKYLTVKLGPSPWKITMEHYEGKVLFANMGTKRNVCIYKPWKRGAGVMSYEIIVPWYYINQYSKHGFTQDNLNRFLKVFKGRFKDDLILWMECREQMNRELPFKPGEKRKFSTKQTILGFCTKFGITEDDMPYETMKKIVYRYFTEKNKPITLIEA
jgi:hypothetical protein